MTFRLKAASGPRTGEAFDLADETLVGSGRDAQIQIENIADHHMVLRFDGERLTLDAKAETHVNGESVTKKALQSGDEIRLGPNRFVLQAPGLRPPSVLSEPETSRMAPWAWIAIGLGVAGGVAAVAAFFLTQV